MLVLDGAKVSAHEQAALGELEKERVSGWARLEEANSVFLYDEETDPTFSPRRLGRMLTAREFESKLSRILPQAQFIWGPLSDIKKKKILSVPAPDGSQILSMVYESERMPERSIMSRNLRDVPDFSQTKLERKDLPKHEYVPGEGFVWDKSKPLPGMKRISVPWREDVRGWRAILLGLIKAGFITVAQAEKEFYGADNTPEWKQGTGKGPTTRPW